MSYVCIGTLSQNIDLFIFLTMALLNYNPYNNKLVWFQQYNYIDVLLYITIVISLNMYKEDLR